MELKIKIREVREAKQMSQRKLAAACGFSPASVCLWERGIYYPSLENLIKVAEVLEVRLTDLIEETPAPVSTV